MPALSSSINVLPSLIPQNHSPFFLSSRYFLINSQEETDLSKKLLSLVICHALKNPTIASACGHQCFSFIRLSLSRSYSYHKPPSISIPSVAALAINTDCFLTCSINEGLLIITTASSSSHAASMS